MSSRSNWEARNSVLNRLDPSRRAEAEARAASRKPNEAIKLPLKEETQTEPTVSSHTLGMGAAAKAGRKMKRGTTGNIE